MPRLIALLGLAAAAALALSGCTKHRVQVDPIKVEPIHMTVDVRLQVDRELDQYFDYEDELDQPVNGEDSAASDQPSKGDSQ